jgi:hypothetical protein
VLNTLGLFDPKLLRNLQLNSCVNGTIGWSLLVFFTHFLGEVLPLSLLFWMQFSICATKNLKKEKLPVGESEDMGSDSSFVSDPG